MNNLSSSDDQKLLSDLTAGFTESLTETQWSALEREYVYGDTLEAIGAKLGVASTRVRHIQDKAFAALAESFHDEIDSFSSTLEKLLSETDNALPHKDCLASFPQISETEFSILLALSQRIKPGVFHLDKGLISLSNI